MIKKFTQRISLMAIVMVLSVSFQSSAQCGVCDNTIAGFTASNITVPAGQVWCATSGFGLTLSGANTIDGILRLCFIDDAFTSQFTMSGTATVDGSGAIEFTTCPDVAPAISAALTSTSDHPSLRDCDNACGGTDVMPAGNWTPAVASECNSVLPIMLGSFNGEYDNGVVELNWTTLSEVNNDFFTLERSSNGIYFETIGIQQGSGTTLSVHEYSMSDLQPNHPVTYYKLTQTDYDGESETFPIIAVETGEVPMSIYPNPTTGNFRIENTDFSETIAKSSVLTQSANSVKIYSIHGTLIKSFSYSGVVYEGSLDSVPTGTYFVEVSGSSGIYRQSLVKI